MNVASPMERANKSLPRKTLIKPVTIPKILFRVFLFHFKKVLSHFSLFQGVSVNTS